MYHQENLRLHPVYESCPGYGTRHERALLAPRGAEKGIASMLLGWAEYADQHRMRYGDGIGEDNLLGPEWAHIGAAIRMLLNGELGRLDGGVLDHAICSSMKAEGFDPEDF